MNNLINLRTLESIDKDANIIAAKLFLQQYEFWHLQRSSYESWNTPTHLKSPIDKTSTEKVAKVYLECELRTKTLESMKLTNENLSFLADVLNLRYIKRYKIKKACEVLAESHNLDYCGERSFNRYQKDALWKFAQACPYNLLIKKNNY